MSRYLIFLYFVCLNLSCNSRQNKKSFLVRTVDVNDSIYVVNPNYVKGDSRRYGVFPNEPISQTHFNKIIHLASKGQEISFSEGFYKTNLILDSVSDVNFRFHNALFAGGITIVNNSNKVKLSGNITVLDRVFIHNSKYIVFDTINVVTDETLNLFKKKNRGVSLYSKTKNVTFFSLNIYDTGGSNDYFYKHTAASLQIHGWNNNPEFIHIKSIKINNAGRTGLYITGNGHKIDKAIITNFGLGSSKNMFGLEDAASGEEREFSGAWINRCNNCEIDSLIVNSTLKKGNYSLRLDEGKYHEPTFIYNIRLENNARNLPIKDDELTNILVKNEF